MTAPTLKAISEGIETRLATITGLNHNNVRPNSQFNLPLAFVDLPSVLYHRSMGHGKFELTVPVVVLTSRTVDRVGQELLMSYMDIAASTSIHAAVEGDKTLGGIVDYCIVQTAVPDDQILVSGIEYYGATFGLEIVAPGI